MKTVDSKVALTKEQKDKLATIKLEMLNENAKAISDGTLVFYSPTILKKARKAAQKLFKEKAKNDYFTSGFKLAGIEIESSTTSSVWETVVTKDGRFHSLLEIISISVQPLAVNSGLEPLNEPAIKLESIYYIETLGTWKYFDSLTIEPTSRKILSMAEFDLRYNDDYEEEDYDDDDYDD